MALPYSLWKVAAFLCCDVVLTVHTYLRMTVTRHISWRTLTTACALCIVWIRDRCKERCYVDIPWGSSPNIHINTNKPGRRKKYKRKSVWTSTDDAVSAVSFSMQTTEVCSSSLVFHSNVIGSNFFLRISTWDLTASRASPCELRNNTNKPEEWNHLYYIQSLFLPHSKRCRGRVIGIKTGCGLDDPWFESW